MQALYGSCIVGSDILIKREKKVRSKLNKAARVVAQKYYHPNKVNSSLQILRRGIWQTLLFH
jgi:hypothetical protein